MASSGAGLPKESRITHPCNPLEAIRRIFCQGHSKEIREECWAVTTCHCLLRSQFASPERCQIWRWGLKSPQESILLGWGLQGQGWAVTREQEGKGEVRVISSSSTGSSKGKAQLCPLRSSAQGWKERSTKRGMHPQISSTSAPTTATKTTGKEKKPKTNPHFAEHRNQEGRLLGEKKKQNKKPILLLHLERDRDISLNAINLHRPKH